MINHRAEAVNLLNHYIARVMTKAGLKPDRDTDAELETLVDHIIQAAVDEMVRMVTQHIRAAIRGEK